MPLTNDRGRFYTTEDLGQKRSTTPDGFLVCHDVPIARTGQQLYSDQEIPIEGGPDGLVRIDRAPDEVFRPETIASFEGKPVTVEHPNEFVTPENWQQLAVGIVQNVRRGSGSEDDLLIADLVITDAAAIKYVNEKLPEVSAGYEAAYEQTEPGRGVQRGIVGNHVALVERGRAGPRCAIKDEEIKMTKRTFWDRILTAVKAQDAEAVKAEMAEMSAEPVKTGDALAISELTAAVKALTADVASARAEIAALKSAKTADDMPDGDPDDKDPTADDDDEDDKDKTGDDVLNAEQAGSNPDAVGTVLSGDSLKALKSRAEILAPGSAIKTADAKKATGQEATAFMRATLDKAMGTEDGKKAVETILAGRDIKKLTGDSLMSVFVGAAEILRAQNTRRTAGAASTAATRDFGRASSVSDINSRNRDFWANRNAL